MPDQAAIPYPTVAKISWCFLRGDCGIIT
jgi:hypothetical protein